MSCNVVFLLNVLLNIDKGKNSVFPVCGIIIVFYKYKQI